MAQDEKKEDKGIHQIDTVPPPPGEDDAYSAPTRVGAMPPEVLEALRNAGINMDKKSAPRVPAAPVPRPAVAAPRPAVAEPPKVSVESVAAEAAPVASAAPAPAALPNLAPTSEPPPFEDVLDAELRRNSPPKPAAPAASAAVVVPANEEDEDNAATRLHPAAKPLPAVLGEGSVPQAPTRTRFPREAILVLVLVAVLVALAFDLGVR